MEQTRRFRMAPRRTGRGDGGPRSDRPTQPTRPARSRPQAPPDREGARRAAQGRGVPRATSSDPRSPRSTVAPTVSRAPGRVSSAPGSPRRSAASSAASSAPAGRSRRGRSNKGSGKGDRFSFLVTLVVVILAAISLGYLIGQYMYDVVMNPKAPVMVQAGLDDSDGVSDVLSGELTGSSGESDAVSPGEVDYRVQVGAFAQEENATRLRDELEARGYRVRVTEGTPYRVQIEGTGTRRDAEELVDRLEDEFPGAFIL